MNLDAKPLGLKGCYGASLATFSDVRGAFQKLFHEDTFSEYMPGFLPREAYLSSSHKGVLRGMHFQLPPHDHGKVVICLSGAALDVIVDLREGADFGQTTSVELTPEGISCVLLPPGVGHGFYAHEDNTQLLYLVETVHSQQADAGVMWDSCGFDWPSSDPILSERDTKHPSLTEFVPPEAWRNG